jgi:hypothetical protein
MFGNTCLFIRLEHRYKSVRRGMLYKLLFFQDKYFQTLKEILLVEFYIGTTRYQPLNVICWYCLKKNMFSELMLMFLWVS